jgi:hypothetical protein
MTDETSGQAAAPAEVTTEPVNLEAEAPQEKAVVAEEKPEAEPKDAVAASDGEDGDEQEDKPKKRSGIQRLKAREKALLAENAELMRRLEQSKPAEKGGEEEAPPKEDDFGGDWGEYIAAKAAYKIRQDRRAEVRAESERKAQADQASVWRERMSDHQERIEELKETVKDFDEAIKSASGISIREELGAEIVMSEKSAQLQYYLAKNQDKLRELNGMSGRELAKEIGRLEATLKLPAAKKQTTAPAPLKPLGGGAGPGVDLAKADMATYVAERKRQGFGSR